jgi:hypothetical protein
MIIPVSDRLGRRKRFHLAAGAAAVLMSFLPAVSRAQGAEPRVVDAFKFGYERRTGDMTEEEYKENRGKAGLNDIVIVKVQNLEPLLDRARCLEPIPQTVKADAGAPPATPAPGPSPSPVAPTPMGKRLLSSSVCRPQEILLYLDGRAIPDLEPESGAPDPEAGTLRYHLRRNEASEEHWADLLGLDATDPSISPRVAKLSVGLANEYPIQSDVDQFRLVRIRPVWGVVWLISTIVLVVVLIHLGRRSDVLRAREVQVEFGQRKPYSLGQSQAAWWFVLTVISFLFIWAVTGQHDNLPTEVLILLSIGLGTALGAKVIDKGKEPVSPDERAELRRLLTEKAALDAELDGKSGRAQPVSRDELRKKYAETVAAIKAKFPGTMGIGSKRYDLDVLSDADGVSFHRFQMATWTLVLGFIFLEAVISRLAMPHFNETLLALMGLSAGTYLGFKIPEAKSPPAPAAPQTPAAAPPSPAPAGAPPPPPPTKP